MQIKMDFFVKNRIYSILLCSLTALDACCLRGSPCRILRKPKRNKLLVGVLVN